MKAFILGLAGLILMLPGAAYAEGFTDELFEAWLDMRTGGGVTDVYWYSEGELKSFPGGETEAKMIGFDTSHLLRDPENPRVATQLSRKIFYWFDPETGERLDREPIAYEYQVKTYELTGDKIVYAVESRTGPRISFVGPSDDNYSAKRIGDVLWFNYPVFIDRGPGKFENSDFYVQPSPDLNEQERYQHVWVSQGPGPIMSRAVAWRYSRFEDMPAEITKIVREEAPLWMAPPRDLDEIEALRTEVDARGVEAN